MKASTYNQRAAGPYGGRSFFIAWFIVGYNVLNQNLYAFLSVYCLDCP